MVHIALEDTEIHFVETLQMVHNWILGIRGTGSFHSIALVLYAGMSFAKFLALS